ncbi:MAG: hypothetical protein ACLQVI_22540 [Polyangiaceae bacterium]
MDATFLATLRQLFPRVTFSPPSGETTELGAVLDVSVRDRAIVVTLEHGGELRFYAGMPAWRVLEAHLRTGDLKFDDPELGLRRLAELLGTFRDHFDA